MFTFSKNQRLLKRSEFQVILNSQHKAVTPFLVVKAKKSSTPTSRLGLIVSKKVGSAVVRNRVKRLLRECYRTRDGDTAPLDIVVIARHQAGKAQLEDIRQNLQESLKRLARKV